MSEKYHTFASKEMKLAVESETDADGYCYCAERRTDGSGRIEKG